MPGASGLAKNEVHHDRNHTTGNPKQLALLKCQVWRDYERLGRRQQQWPDAADVRAGAQPRGIAKMLVLKLMP